MKSRSLRAPLAVLTLAVFPAFVPFSVLAQGTLVNTLPETVVTATRNPLPLTAAMHHTTVISREDIERSQASDLVTLLQREAGLQRTQNGGVGTVSSVFLRGAPSLQTLVLVDGVPLNKQDASGAVSLEHLMLDNIERVEIVRGNVSAIYGSGAIGGVIQIFTRTGAREPSAQLSLELGPRSTAKVSAQVSTQVGDTAISAGASRFRTDGFSSVNPAQFAGANPDADGYANTSLNLSLTHQLAPRHQAGVRLSSSTGDTAYDNASSSVSAAKDVQASSTRLNQVSLFADNTWGDWRSRVSLSNQTDQSRTRDNSAFGSNNGFRTQASVLSWVNTVGLGGDWLATGGLERQWQRVTTETSSAFVTPYDARRNTTAWFGGLEGGLGPGSIQFNLRDDKVGELDKTTYYLGYSLPVTTQLKLLASTSTAFNAPPLGYLFAPSFGNPNLKPESAQSQELGLQFEGGPHLLRVTWFSTRVTNELAFVGSAFTNVNRTRNRGLEASYQGTLGQTRMRAALTLQDPKNEITGAALIRRARTLWSVGATHTVAGADIDIDLRYVGSRTDRYGFPAVQTSLPSYTVIDLAASYALTPEVKLRARIDNVTDKVYQTVYGYNQQPRSLYLGLDWRPSF